MARWLPDNCNFCQQLDSCRNIAISLIFLIFRTYCCELNRKEPEFERYRLISSLENRLIGKGLTMPAHQQDAQRDVPTQIRRILAIRLRMDESVLTDDFRWLSVVDPVAEEEFLADLSDTFTVIPPGLSFGSGRSPFEKAERDTLEKIATVGGLITHVKQHLARCASPQ